MMAITRSLGILLFAMVLGIILSANAARASQFTEALTKDYFELATLQYYYSDDPFAVKARAADSGKNVLPDDPAAEKLSSQDRAELTSAHGRLMAALNGGFREQSPKQASKAQTNFDCWLRSVVQAGGKDWKCIKQCRDAFEKAMAAWTPPVAAPAPAPPPPMAKPMPKAAPPPRSFIVFFDWNRADIRADAQQVLETAAAYVKQRGFARINLVGHADRSGKASYNMGLSQRRADASKAVLVKLGLPASGIATVGRGESAPLVGTADGVREPRNRRVEISF
jgi:outer membrane protein OmpA-like peptidoglycan-associated protein